MSKRWPWPAARWQWAACPAVPLAASGRKAPDAIFHGGPILTMIKDNDRVEALAVKDGKIVAAGPLADIMSQRDAKTNLVDLGGKCLMPGFFDPHSHVVLQSVKFSVVNLDPKPIGYIGSMADIQNTLKKWIKDKKPKPGQWVLGWGYDDTGIKEQRHPNRRDLDKVSTDYPILLVHSSCHIATGNSKMLTVCGITADTPNPHGGRIQREEDGKTPNGVLEESAWMEVMKHMPAPTPEKAMEIIQQGVNHYARAGITTAQDCASGKGSLKLLKAMEMQGKLPIDVIAWPLYKIATDERLLKQVAEDRRSTKRVRCGGVKLVTDGSIQGYTAYLSKPYYVQPRKTTQTVTDQCDAGPAQQLFVSRENEAGHDAAPQRPKGLDRGYPGMSQEEVNTWVERMDRAGIQMQVHTNGDAATDLLLNAVKKVRGGKARPELRTVIIHAQTMREDQLDLAAEHGLSTSFFPIHVYFWGDRHRDIFLGPERAARIDPARSALKRNIKFTLHHDAPVAGIDMLTVAWSAVNRITTSGKELGPNQRITPFEALRAVTADAAWQNFEEDRKGTLEPGKLADMVILSRDPLAVEPMKMRDIKVLATIKEARFVYRAKA